MNTTTDTAPSTHKAADKQSIKDAALKLISTGSTTNLDIKNELRSNGFWVSQDEVRDAMNSIASEENFDRTWNGRFNTWTLPTASTPTTDPTQDATTPIPVITAATDNTTATTATTNQNTAGKLGETDVIDAISRKLGIYKQAIKVSSDLAKDLGFIDRDYVTIGAVFGKDIKDCKKVQDIINLI